MIRHSTWGIVVVASALLVSLIAEPAQACRRNRCGYRRHRDCCYTGYYGNNWGNSCWNNGNGYGHYRHSASQCCVSGTQAAVGNGYYQGGASSAANGTYSNGTNRDGALAPQPADPPPPAPAPAPAESRRTDRLPAESDRSVREELPPEPAAGRPAPARPSE